MTKQQASEIVSVLLNATRADEMFISLNATDTVSVQFANNLVLRSFSSDSASIQITIRVGNQYGSATGNQFDTDQLNALVKLAESQIGKLPKRDEIIPFAGETSIQPAALSAENEVGDTWRLEQIQHAIELAKEKKVLATGILNTSKNTVVLASSNGLFLHQDSTPAHFLVRVMNSSGSSTGFREEYSYDASTLDTKAVASFAVDSCLAWSKPKELKPDRITTVFTPLAFAEMLLPYMRQFDLAAYKQKRSFLNKLDGSSRLGNEMYNPWVNISSDPYHEAVPAIPFTPEGVPITKQTWVKNGVINAIVTSRFDAYAEKTEAIPFPTNFIMEGGEESLDQIIASTERGLLVNGFASLSVEDHNNCLLTGSTRDGLFLIEGGKISGAVSNLVIRETPIYLLKRKEALGIPQKASPKGTFLPMLVPSIRSTDVMYIRQSDII